MRINIMPAIGENGFDGQAYVLQIEYGDYCREQKKVAHVVKRDELDQIVNLLMDIAIAYEDELSNQFDRYSELEKSYEGVCRTADRYYYDVERLTEQLKQKK